MQPEVFSQKEKLNIEKQLDNKEIVLVSRKEFK